MKIKKILVSQPQPTDSEKSPYVELVRKYGVEIDFHKFIKIEGVTARDFRKDRIYLENYTAIILTSRNAVDHYFRIAKELRFEVPDTMKYFCTSEATAFYLQKYVQYRKRKIFFGKQTPEDLMEVIRKHKDERFLLPCSDIHKNDLPILLDEQGIKYDKAIIYKTLASDLSHLDISQYDMLVFFSPAGVKSLFKNFPDFEQNSTLIGAFGTKTATAVTESNLRLDVCAPTASAPSMTMALDEYLQKAAKKK
ncbi:MAG TPA: uroporphyrinogen-III synthase [Bacteroidales bacterium]|nr:uroporphyrinogen-III synthase [Bacteroidales bacterium]